MFGASVCKYFLCYDCRVKLTKKKDYMADKTIMRGKANSKCSKQMCCLFCCFLLVF